MSSLVVRLVPVSPDLLGFDIITIAESDQDKELILGRGKLTGIQDVKVSRKQIYVTFHAPNTETGESAFLSITVKGGKPSYIFRNANKAETIEVSNSCHEKVFHNDLLYLLRDKFAYRFEVVDAAAAETEAGPPRKKRRVDLNGDRSLSELELLQQEHEKLKASSAKQIRILSARIQVLQDNTIDLETSLEKVEKKNLALERNVSKLQKQIKALKASEAKEKSKYNTLKTQYDSNVPSVHKTQPTITQPMTGKRRRGRPSLALAAKRNRDFSEDESDKDSDEMIRDDKFTVDPDIEMEDSSEDDELTETRVAEIEQHQIGEPWVDRAGQTCRWVSPGEFTDGINRFYTSILIDKRCFSIGDAIYAFSPHGSDSYIGKIVCLYQTPLNKRRVQIQWFYNQNELLASSKVSQRDLKQQQPEKKELFASSIVDTNDVGVLDKHCIIKSADTSESLEEIIAWSKGTSGRFFFQKYFDNKSNTFVTETPSPLQVKYSYPEGSLQAL